MSIRDLGNPLGNPLALPRTRVATAARGQQEIQGVRDYLSERVWALVVDQQADVVVCASSGFRAVEASHGSVRSFEDLSTRAVLSGYLTSLTSRLIGCHYDDVTKTVFFVGYQISSAQGVGQSGIIVSINLDTGATSSFKFDVDNRYHTVFYSSPYCLVWGGTGTGGSGRAIKLNLEDGTAYRWVPSNAKEVGRFFRGANGQIVLAYVENSGGSAAVIMCNYDPTTDVATEGVKINGIGSSGQIDQNQFFCDGQNTYISSSGSSYRQIVKLSPDNTVLWAKEVSNTASLQMNAGTICADDDHVYISYRSGVVVLDANTGSLVLDARFNGLGASHQLALTSSKLIVASDHGLVVKLAKGTLELPKDSDTIGLSRSTEGASVSISALTGVSVVAQTVTPSFSSITPSGSMSGFVGGLTNRC